MPTINIAVVFNQGGHGDINIIPSNCEQWEPGNSSDKDFELEAGEYSVTFVTTTMHGGSIKATLGEQELGGADLAEGPGGGNFDINF